MDPLKKYLLLKMWIFHCYVRLPEGTASRFDFCETDLTKTSDICQKMRVLCSGEMPEDL